MSRAPRGVYPRAIWRPVPQASWHRPISPTAVAVHSNAGAGRDLYGWWLDPRADGAFSHFQVGLDGTVWQYASIFVRSAATYKANPYTVSIETANNPGHGTFPGFDTDTWTGPQHAALIDLIQWITAEANIPRIECVDGFNGIGAHDWFPWWVTPTHVCPGRARSAQLRQDIIPAVRTGTRPGDDMNPTQEKLLRATRNDAALGAVRATQAWDVAKQARDAALQAGITEIYWRRLDRGPDPKGLAVWTGYARKHGLARTDERIAGSGEARRYASIA